MISSYLQPEEHAVGEHRHHDLDAGVVDAWLAHLDPRLAHEVDGVHDDGGEYHGRAGDPLLLDVLAARRVGPLEARHVGVDLVAQLGLGLGVGVELGLGPCWRGAGNTVGAGDTVVMLVFVMFSGSLTYSLTHLVTAPGR